MAYQTEKLPNGRRLFELLDQQQEPFLLKAYILENGCSSSVAFNPDALMKCFSMKSFKMYMDFSKWRRTYAMPSCLHEKMPHWKLLKKTMNCCYFRARNNGIRMVLSCFPGRKNGAKSWEKMMQETKLLSTVSILELHSDEVRSFQNTATASSLDSEKYEMQFYSNTYYQHTERSGFHGLLQSKKLLLNCVKEIEGSIWDSHANVRERRVFSMKKQRGSNASRHEQLMDGEELLSFSRTTEWDYLQAEKTKICIEIEDIIFHDIREESVMEMLASI